MKKIFILMLLSSFIACGSFKVASRIKQIELGMTKQEVVSIVGSSFEIAHATKTYEGNFKTIRYYDSLNDEWYALTFMNGKLVEWYKELAPAPPIQNHNHENG